MRNTKFYQDGKLAIYPRSRIFHARIYTGPNQPYLYRTLGTSDPREAEDRGLELYFSTKGKLARGEAVRSMSFNSVIDAYVAFRENSHRQGGTTAAMLRQIHRVVKFWREYAGDRPVEAIDDKMLRGYLDWRRNYYFSRPIPPNGKLNPKPKTLEWEMILAKQILKWAHEQGFRGPPPTFSFTAKERSSRPPFVNVDLTRLLKKLDERYRTSPDDRIRRSRKVLLAYVVLLMSSGLRVGEANNLRMRDVQFVQGDKNYVSLDVVGKTGKRNTIVRSVSSGYLAKWIKFRTGEGATPDDYVFAMPNGSRIITLADQFNAALVDADIKHASTGESYSLYSLRHYYAIERLKSGIGVFELAKNMGTSAKMIELYYARHATPHTFAKKLAA